MEENQLALAEKIKKIRKEKGMSQAELAKKIGINIRMISLYESGKSTPSMETIQKLASLFGVTTDYLCYEGPMNYESMDIKDKSLIPVFEEIDRMNEKEKEVIKFFVEAVAFKRRTKEK
jgi:transcriptional regulator with XRE-family HTH domain